MISSICFRELKRKKITEEYDLLNKYNKCELKEINTYVNINDDMTERHLEVKK